MIHNFANFSDSLAAINLKQTLEKADRVLADIENITYKINNNQGSLGLLVNDKKLYNELEAQELIIRHSRGFVLHRRI